MAKKVKRGGKAWKSAYSAYKAENRVEKNAVRRLKRHLKEYPNDELAAKRLEIVTKEGRLYKRNKGKKSHTWSPVDIMTAQLCNIRVQTPVINRKGPLPEWKQKLAQAFGRS